MSLSTDTLSAIARKNAGIGRTIQQQGAAVVSIPSPAPSSGQGVDVEAAIWAEVIVRPTGGDVVFTIYGRSIGDSVFDVIAEGSGLSAVDGLGFKTLLRCPTLAEVYVKLDSGAATSTSIFIAPCGG